MIGTFKITTHQVILLLIISSIATEGLKTDTEKKYEKYLKRIENFPLQAGPNIENYKEPQYYNHKWFVGVKIFIMNYSNMLLSDAQVEFYCTANQNKNNESFEALGDIQPRSKDLLELSNGAKHWVSTCGSISWQIKQPDGSQYLVKTSQGSQGLRVGLSWNVPWTALEKCGEGIHNQMNVKTFNNKVDDAGNWLNANQVGLYKIYETQLFTNQDNPSERITLDYRARVKQNKKENFPLIASITTGCKANLTLRLLQDGVRGPTVPPSATSKPAISTGSVSTTMTIIYVVSGFVGLLLVAVLGRGFCVMRNRMREHEEEE